MAVRSLVAGIDAGHRAIPHAAKPAPATERCDAELAATLQTPRLELRPAGADDLDTLLALWPEKDVRRFLFGGVCIARQHAVDLLFESRSLVAEGLGLWLVHRHGFKQPVGSARLQRIDRAGQSPSPGGVAVSPTVALRPDSRGRGYALEASAALVDHASHRFGRSPIVAVCDVPNHAANRMLRRLGFAADYEVDGDPYRLRRHSLKAE